MGSNTQFIFGEYAMLKIIEEPDGVRLKICPRVPKDGQPADGLRPDDRFDELTEAREITLPRREANLAIKAVRHARNRIWGRDE